MKSQGKAFMSDRAGRPSWGSYASPCYLTHAEQAECAFQAEREASMILAHTEPSTFDDDTEHVSAPTIRALRLETRRDPILTAAGALADALAAFVALPIRCSVCGEESTDRSSVAGLVHKYGPTGHVFAPSL